jgi:hypothetical protein
VWFVPLTALNTDLARACVDLQFDLTIGTA